MVQIIVILLVVKLALITAFQNIIPTNKYIYSTRIPTINDNLLENTSSYTTSILSMGLYEEDIDWDADLFSQISKSNSNQVASDTDNTKYMAEDDKQWDMEEGSSKSVKSMREQMKQSWGGNGSTKKKEEGKPTADWAGAGGGPDEDEPWFTG